MRFEIKVRCIARDTLVIDAEDTPQAEMKATDLILKGGINNEPQYEITSIKEI